MIDTNHKKNNQQTISNSISVKGIGLHTGNLVELTLEPAAVDNGIKFIRVDKKNDNVIEAIWSNVSETVLSTTISNSCGIKISTIEHLMSALSGLHIDNLNIYINANEVPIMDGSSKPFVEMIEQIGSFLRNSIFETALDVSITFNMLGTGMVKMIPKPSKNGLTFCKQKPSKLRP